MLSRRDLVIAECAVSCLGLGFWLRFFTCPLFKIPSPQDDPSGSSLGKHNAANLRPCSLQCPNSCIDVVAVDAGMGIAQPLPRPLGRPGITAVHLRYQSVIAVGAVALERSNNNLSSNKMINDSSVFCRILSAWYTNRSLMFSCSFPCVYDAWGG